MWECCDLCEPIKCKYLICHKVSYNMNKLCHLFLFFLSFAKWIWKWSTWISDSMPKFTTEHQATCVQTVLMLYGVLNAVIASELVVECLSDTGFHECRVLFVDCVKFNWAYITFYHKGLSNKLHCNQTTKLSDKKEQAKYNLKTWKKQSNN